jgi:hypothetical protein
MLPVSLGYGNRQITSATDQASLCRLSVSPAATPVGPGPDKAVMARDLIALGSGVPTPHCTIAGAVLAVGDWHACVRAGSVSCVQSPSNLFSFVVLAGSRFVLLACWGSFVPNPRVALSLPVLRCAEKAARDRRSMAGRTNWQREQWARGGRVHDRACYVACVPESLAKGSDWDVSQMPCC